MKLTPGSIPGMHLIKPKKQSQETEKKSKTEGLADFDIEKIPPIVYVANKSEDGFEGEIMADFFRKFPQLTTAINPVTNTPYDPIFISAEHGDGLPDLFQMIKKHIPDSKETEHEDRKEKRLLRFTEFKEMLLEEIVAVKKEEMDREEDVHKDDYTKEINAFVKSWEKEFDYVNQTPEDNSDFDSDNEINPLDTLDGLGRYMNGQAK